jgi:hypothetical protein
MSHSYDSRCTCQTCTTHEIRLTEVITNHDRNRAEFDSHRRVSPERRALQWSLYAVKEEQS